MSDEYIAEVLRALVAERRELLLKLGWTLPPTEDEFWYRDDHGPVHATDVWPFVIEDIERLQQPRMLNGTPMTKLNRTPSTPPPPPKKNCPHCLRPI